MVRYLDEEAVRSALRWERLIAEMESPELKAPPHPRFHDSNA